MTTARRTLTGERAVVERRWRNVRTLEAIGDAKTMG